MGALEPAAAPAGDGRGVTCPWCGSADVHELGPYGTLLMTAQWFCEACHSPFERVRHRGEGEPGA
jgi:transposase-like protein